MTQEFKDLEAVQKLVEALQEFDQKDQERIIRWAKEKLGLTVKNVSEKTGVPSTQVIKASKPRPNDIKTFINSKNPKAANHFAVTVAYYYKFEAPEDQRKDFITGEDLQEACRQVGRERFTKPSKTLNNTHNNGYLDKGPERGTYVINTVGENLVAMALPSQ
jgi:hypothetical protein